MVNFALRVQQLKKILLPKTCPPRVRWVFMNSAKQVLQTPCLFICLFKDTRSSSASVEWREDKMQKLEGSCINPAWSVILRFATVKWGKLRKTSVRLLRFEAGIWIGYLPSTNCPGQRNRYRDWLRCGRSGDRIPIGARHSTPVHIGPAAQTPNGHQVIPRGKAAGAWRSLPTPCNAEVKERVEICLYSLSGPSWHFVGLTSPFSK